MNIFTTPIPDPEFFELRGQIITAIHLGDITTIRTETKRYKLEHQQDCCEVVKYVASNGDLGHIIGHAVTLAEEDQNEDPPSWYVHPDGFTESRTFSTFTIQTDAGRFQILFLGESNGYYGETMSFQRTDRP